MLEENGVNGESPTPTGTPPEGGEGATPQGAAPTQPIGGEGGQGAEPDKTVPYSRFKEVNDELNTRKAKESADALLQSGKENGNGGGQTPPAIPAAPAGEQPLTKADIEKVVDAKVDTKLGVEKRVQEATTMVKDYDGSNGLPAFDIDVVTDYMKKNGLQNVSYETAYRILHQDAITAKAVQDALDGNAGQVTIKGGKVFAEPPSKDTVSREGIAKMPLEAYKKSGGSKALRDKILTGQIK